MKELSGAASLLLREVSTVEQTGAYEDGNPAESSSVVSSIGSPLSCLTLLVAAMGC